MTDEANIEDVESTEEYRKAFGVCDSDSNPEGVDSDKVAEEDSEDSILGDIIAEVEEAVEELPPLPTAEEAEFGELCRTPRRGQFDQCELVDDDSGDLIEAFEEGEQ